MPMNHGVAIRADHNEIAERRNSLLLPSSKRIEVVDVREASADFAIDGLETKATTGNLAPDQAVVGLLRGLT